VPRDQQTGAQELPEEAAAAAAANLEQVNAQLEASGESTLTFDDVCFDAKRLHNGGGKRCFDVVQKERNAGGDRRGTRSTPAFTPEPPQARPRPGEVEQLMAAAGPSIDAVLGDGSLEYPVTTRRASALAAGAAPAERSEAEGLETAAAAAAAAAAAMDEAAATPAAEPPKKRGRPPGAAARQAAEEAEAMAEKVGLNSKVKYSLLKSEQERAAWRKLRTDRLRQLQDENRTVRSKLERVKAQSEANEQERLKLQEQEMELMEREDVVDSLMEDIQTFDAARELLEAEGLRC